MPVLPRALHETDRPSATAQAVALYRALELRRPPGGRIVSDEFAPLFLGRAGRALLGPLSAAQPVRERIARVELGGLSTYVLCRHRFIDEQLLASLDDRAEQVLILGAGYDSRAYRFADRLGPRPVFEVDLPPLSQQKAAIVAANRSRFGTVAVHRVEIDFRTQSLADRLTAAGFAHAAWTFVAWEGVVPYLDAAAVASTLRSLASLCGPGSRLALDLWDGTGGRGPLAPLRRLGARAIALIGEPVTFGVAPGAAGPVLEPFTVTDLAGAAELSARYATAGRRSIESLYVVAAQLP